MRAREPRPNFVAECILVRNLSGKNTSFIMVEGETDRVALKSFKAKNTELFPSRGKDNILVALKSGIFEKVPGVAGIVDLDYTLICDSYERDLPNLLYDCRCPDMELMLLESPALRKLLRNMFVDIDPAAIHDFADRLCSEAHRLASEFGYFRLLNHIRGYGLPCNSIHLCDVIDRGSLELDRSCIAKRLTETNPDLASDELLREIEELKAAYPHPGIQLCRGKDVLEIIAVIQLPMFQAEFEGGNADHPILKCTGSKLASDLRLAYESVYFSQTSLYSCIRAWENMNSPYKILQRQI